ncbi:TonB-dependent receptor [Carboxylicivirga sediminis]|uniref:TonB-dependent receptor n=1 Tax=Carboxylicivirga sediminis TaxID=2006564 RepID=A0A941J0X7_9BACT|nr:TonB-dependent receptor plug domain-containing protein [Carboxylicivirga sediminis]MBR8538289.1 TonB-dependent receptor [Carboxylicivirga sediminis]
MKHLFLLIFLLLLTNVFAQPTAWCIKGGVFDEADIPVPSVHITTLDGKKGTVSDAEGRFELCGLAGDSVILLIGHTAFERQRLVVYKDRNKELEIYLTLKTYSTKEVQIKGQQNAIVSNYIPGKLSLKKKDILNLPAFMGSPDVLRGLQLLPGMQSVSEGNSGIYVRGGSPGQNYVLFDGIELMNPTHLMGIYSVFNPLLTEHVDFYKGNAPIHLSSRLASSIIVDTYHQKIDSSNWAGNIGNIITNLTYNGQSANNKWYFATGIRRSYLDVLGYMARPFLSDEENYFEQNAYTFYDWNGKVSYQSGRNQVQLTWYVGQDDFQMDNPKHQLESHSKWGNWGTAMQWKHTIQLGFMMEHTISYSSYFSNFGASIPDGTMHFDTDYSQVKLQSGFSMVADKHFLRWGSDFTFYNIIPQQLEVSNISSADAVIDEYKSLAIRPYISDYYTFSDSWSLYAGLGFNAYKLMHSGRNGKTTRKDNGVQMAPNIILTLNYNRSRHASYKWSYAYTTQDIHLASVASIPLPSDIWMPASEALPLEASHQLTAGYFKSYTDKKLQWGIELYGKYMHHQLLVKLNQNQSETERFEDNFYLGQGLGYGSELYLSSSDEKLSYTLSYTLGWVHQQFDDINSGRWHDAKYDRRHDLNLQASYKLNKRLDLGAVFIFATGNKATLPTGRYWLMGEIASDYSGVNNFRMPAYHRMDVSLNYHLSSNLFKESVLNFSIINLYGRSNPYYIYYQVEEGQQDYALSIKAKQVSLFPIMPSISWRFKF